MQSAKAPVMASCTVYKIVTVVPANRMKDLMLQYSFDGQKTRSARYQTLTRYLYQQNVAATLKLSSPNIYLKKYLPKLLSLF